MPFASESGGWYSGNTNTEIDTETNAENPKTTETAENAIDGKSEITAIDNDISKYNIECNNNIKSIEGTNESKLLQLIVMLVKMTSNATKTSSSTIKPKTNKMRVLFGSRQPEPMFKPMYAPNTKEGMQNKLQLNDPNGDANDFTKAMGR